LASNNWDVIFVDIDPDKMMLAQRYATIYGIPIRWNCWRLFQTGQSDKQWRDIYIIYIGLQIWKWVHGQITSQRNIMTDPIITFCRYIRPMCDGCSPTYRHSPDNFGKFLNYIAHSCGMLKKINLLDKYYTITIFKYSRFNSQLCRWMSTGLGATSDTALF